MITVHKYPLPIVAAGVHNVPRGAVPLHVGLDPHGDPSIWMRVDTERPFQSYPVYVVGTGHELPVGATIHLGSFLQHPFVWHVFVEKESVP